MKPDSLTIQLGDHPNERDEWYKNISKVIKPYNILRFLSNTRPCHRLKLLVILWNEHIATDSLPAEVFQMLKHKDRHMRKIVLTQYSECIWRLTHPAKLIVPVYQVLQLCLILIHYDSNGAGHLARSKMLELIQREYYWQGMQADIDRFVRNFHTCKRSRIAQYSPFGVPRPLLIPQQRWENISIVFVMELPWSKGCNKILVLADIRAKMGYLICYRLDTDTQDLVRIFIRPE